MNLPDSLHNAIDRLQNAASVKSVYGEPIQAQGKTIIPVARVAYGFGGGSGTSPGSNEEQAQEGLGGGGGVMASPVGVIEVTPETTTFIPISNTRRMVGIAMLGFVFGVLWSWRKRRRDKR